MGQNQFTAIGAAIGAVLAYPVSYFFQSEAFRMKISFGRYFESFSRVMNTGELRSTVLVCLVLSVGAGAAIGYFLGRSAQRQA